MIDALGIDWSLFAVGAGGGLVLGLAARLGRFCTLGAIEDLHYGGNAARMRMWAVALGTAILATFAAALAGLVNPDAVAYLGPGAPTILGAALGGVIFGYGMALAGNCGYGALARLGGGDLRALMIVLVLGISAYVTLSGPLAAPRVALFVVETPAAPRGLAQGAGALLGLPAAVPGLLAGLLVLAVALLPGRDRPSSGQAAWGVAVGLAIASGFVGVQAVIEHGLAAAPLASHSFAAPVGESLLYVMTASGARPSFAVGSVAGVLAGAFAGCLRRRHFRWEACEDPRELRRQIGGAALMGLGAVLAGGCSVGQGLSGFAALAVTAPVVLVAIWLGAALGLRQLIVGFRPAA
ncbi:YeeE/YedE family protein [Rubellimicrobium sp. CFH 75288]|uniref:YeeE/YedE family protein n=1 Tax=Rubellimicrobium sp. CFH 75288 TaxID=2697034 RepID=UPI001412E078|nr:YeeE/YedE family protein [Rubellimicrobium sp. CFH 75288]NAZ35680.1 YeeE/YedE family protein [Rubellimicrobium sp. CFH 75288]